MDIYESVWLVVFIYGDRSIALEVWLWNLLYNLELYKPWSLTIFVLLNSAVFQLIIL